MILIMETRNIVFLQLICLFVLFGVTLEVEPHSPKESKTIKHSVVTSWADKLGIDIWHLGDFITKRKEVQESFKEAKVVPRKGAVILDTITNELKAMFKAKIGAVGRIVENAENTAMYHQKDPVNKIFQYFNSKMMLLPDETPPPNETRSLDDRSIETSYVPPSYIVLKENAQFFNTPVNLSVSSVHVPTNVFDRADNVLKDIQWSEKLDSVFKDNYKNDPTLSWQFFGSSTGFMRQYPASRWRQDPVDLYDCRLRPWYIEAAASPKDMIILVDISGSMTGQRKDIAKHVVSNILETLTTNDFINIFKFSEHIESVVPCFNESLVQATLANLRELNNHMDSIKTGKIANYSMALTKAFEILETYRYNEQSTGCNQAIMLISDGVPYDFKDIFDLYNSGQNSSCKPVRVFTYLIGREVPDFKLIKDMACRNQGFYVHLSVLSEVREQVLNYIPVMGRPLVLGRDDHPVIWTQVYADVVDPKMTDYKWEIKECAEQKEIFMMYLRERGRRGNATAQEEPLRQFRLKKKKEMEHTQGYANYNFMTTISIPVYDKRENATPIANMLGVAGTDVPINEIKKVLMPYLLGVNGYAFIVTNNGYILIHPDFRPAGILKPSYSSIDMIEVELLDDDSEPREFAEKLLAIRDQIVNQTAGSSYMLVKYHLDNLKRVSRVNRRYYWKGIPHTPFTLVVTYPELYGLNQVQARNEDDIHRMHTKGLDVLSFFRGKNWRIHPEWLYCRNAETSDKLETPEERLKFFLKRIIEPGWKWKEHSSQSPDQNLYSNTSTGKSTSLNDKDAYFCNRELVQQLVFEAKVTEWFSRNTTFNTKDDRGNEFKQRFGITVAFLSTQSGLTRWMDFHNNNLVDEFESDLDFSENNNKAIDEVWYRRAVEQHYVEPQSFVFSVPFDAGDNEGSDFLVTASHAIFHTDDKKSAPAAVVGFQFRHSALYSLVKNITSNCGGEQCDRTCFSDDPSVTKELDCFVLDNNGFIVISPRIDETGKFFGEIRGSLMQRLVSERVYEEVKITDYQGICLDPKKDKSPASILQTPFVHMLRLLKWIGRYTIWMMMQTSILPAEAFASYEDEYIYDSSTSEPLENKSEPPSDDKVKAFDTSAVINRTRLQSCDQVRTLYMLSTPTKNKTAYKMTAHSCDRPFVVVPIPHSNLILLIIDALCPVPDLYYRMSIIPIEQYYGNASSLACHRAARRLNRRRPTSCINQHANETFIEQCGRGNLLVINIFFILLAICIGQIL